MKSAPTHAPKRDLYNVCPEPQLSQESFANTASASVEELDATSQMLITLGTSDKEELDQEGPQSVVDQPVDSVGKSRAQPQEPRPEPQQPRLSRQPRKRERRPGLSEGVVRAKTAEALHFPAPAPHVAPARPHRLWTPPPGSERDRLDQEVRALVTRERVVCLVGPPGSGKRTTAIQAINWWYATDDLALGWSIALASAEEPDLYGRVLSQVWPDRAWGKRATKQTFCKRVGRVLLVLTRADALDARVASTLTSLVKDGRLRLLTCSRLDTGVEGRRVDMPAWSLADSTAAARRAFPPHLFPDRVLNLCVKCSVCRPNVVEGRICKSREVGDLGVVLDMCAEAVRRASGPVQPRDVPHRTHFDQIRQESQVTHLPSPAKLMLLAVQQETAARIHSSERNRDDALTGLCSWAGVGRHALDVRAVLANHAAVLNGIRQLQQRWSGPGGPLTQAHVLTSTATQACLAAGRARCAELETVDVSTPRTLRRIQTLIQQVADLEADLNRLDGYVGLFSSLCRDAKPRCIAAKSDDPGRLAYEYVRVLEMGVPQPLRAYVDSLRDHCTLPFPVVCARYQYLLKQPLDPKISQVEPLALELGRTADTAQRRSLVERIRRIKGRAEYRRDRRRVKLARWHATEQCALKQAARLVGLGLCNADGARMCRSRNLWLSLPADVVAQILQTCPRADDPSRKSTTRACKLSRRQAGKSFAAHSDTSDDELPTWDYDDSDTEDEDPLPPDPALTDETRNLFEEVFRPGRSQTDIDLHIDLHIRSMAGRLGTKRSRCG